LRKDFQDWPRYVFGWAVLAFTVLGTGVLLGGVWAYETLGWGGWWVGIRSRTPRLLPWLAGGALVHG